MPDVIRTSFEVLDERFRQCNGDGWAQRLHTGCRWTEGPVISCEQGTRRVTRTEHDGSITVLADRCDGKRLNSPNDVVERADGSIWFTDPSYGIDSDYEGHKAASEIGACHVYRLAPDTGQVSIVADDFQRPNGLAFSLDERQLYIVDTQDGPS